MKFCLFYFNDNKQNGCIFAVAYIADVLTKLSVNINKVALLRNSRGSNLPDLARFALDCVRWGADGITVHPRPDERHIRYADVYLLKEILPCELNVEGYPDERFLTLIAEVRPAQVTLVPDLPGALTSDSGWDTLKHYHFLKETIARLHCCHSTRVSLFINPDLLRIQKAAKVGADRIELYTGPYASFYPYNKEKAVEPYMQAAELAQQLNLGINAGHDLNLENLSWLCTKIKVIDEVSIGHALISDALYDGIERTIQKYQTCLRKDQTH